MKRNSSIERTLKMHLWDPPRFIPTKIMPPRSVVILKKREADWDRGLNIGDAFRIGYYSKQDGLDCVWLANAAGKYEQTWDQASLLTYFEMVSLSDETDLFGINRPKLEPLS